MQYFDNSYLIDFLRMKLDYFAGVSVLIFVMGYTLYRTSNLRKDEFRKNPVSPTVPCEHEGKQKLLLFSFLRCKIKINVLEIYRFGNHPDVTWKEVNVIWVVGLCETSQLFG